MKQCLQYNSYISIFDYDEVNGLGLRLFDLLFGLKWFLKILNLKILFLTHDAKRGVL